MLDSSRLGQHFDQNYMNEKIFEKINIKNVIIMYPSMKFQSIWKTWDFETKFAQNLTDNLFGKKTIKIEISI